MPRFLNAVCKALSVAAGPLGFPGEFALRYYDDHMAEERDIRLNALLSEGQAIQRETLESILDLKDDIVNIREQLIAGLMSISAVPRLRALATSNPQALPEAVARVRPQMADRSATSGFIDDSRFVAELSALYDDNLPLFLATIKLGGFRVAQIPQGLAPRAVFSSFLTRFRGLSEDVRARVLHELSTESPGSIVLSTLSGVWGEAAALSEN